ncbi:MAG: serine/threonine-protein kinase [Phormidesmis sp.]
MRATVGAIASGSMSSLIGKPLQGGKYKLDEVLGRGGFGLTFRAHQTYLDQVIVIKTLNESYWDAPNIDDLQRQFQDEARRLALCSHANVVRVSDFFVEDGLPYMVMDYIPGRSLSDIVLPGNPLGEVEAVTYARQIGGALQAVHDKGLLHRDVKPQNIMIHQLTGEAVLIDFGIARELTKNPAQTHTSIVSEGYAPIEQYLPRAQRSAATDVYGLAATLYTLLTAEVPVAAVLRDRTPLTPISQLRPDVSEAVVGAIAHGMAVELKDRPQSVGTWLSELSGRTRTRLPDTRKPDTRKPDTRRSTTSAAATKVVSPAYQPTQQNRTTVGNRTAATPTGYGVARRSEAYAPVAAPKGRGCGCASTLMILGIAITGAVAGGGYWLYQQANNSLATPPDLGLPDEVKLPESIDFPEVKWPDIKKPKKEKQEQAEDLASESEVENSDEPDYTPLPEDTGSPAEGLVPTVLETIGNSANDQSGSDGSVPTVPGIPPGSSEDQVRDRLGSPTRTESANGYDTAVYSLVPNRVELAYTYGSGELNVLQSEAAFSPSTDRLVMRTALLGMLDGRSTRKIENGLEAVRKGDRDRFDFDRDGFSGAIERNENGYIYLYVRD